MNFLIWRYGLALLFLVFLVSPFFSNSQVAHPFNTAFYAADNAEITAQRSGFLIRQNAVFKSELPSNNIFNNGLLTFVTDLAYNSNAGFGKIEKTNKVPPIVFNGTTITDVSYGSNINYYNVNENLKLDIYIPPVLVANQKFPLVVFFHGGGFLTGDKSVSANICKSIANNGFVTATVNYRIGRDTGLLATTCDDSIEGINSALYRAVQDAKASLRFLISNAASYSIDTNWVFLDGQSSGANIALNTAFLSQDSANVYLPGCQAKLGSLNNATNNLTTTYTLKGIGDFWGSISSVNFITPANAIPIIFTHGRLDPVAPFNSGHQNSCPKFPIVYGSLAMYNRLLSLGVPTVLHEDPTGKHGNIFDDTFNATNMCCFFNSLIYNQPESGYYVGRISSCVPLLFFHDGDSDGYGKLSDSIRAQSPPLGYVANSADCNDANASINPSATEVCNGIDDNCNGQIDEGVQSVFFHDADADGYGNVNDTIHRCAAPVGYISDATDCNDGNVLINPSATEVCNGIDDNCNGQIDEGVQSVFFHDTDGDGFGNLNDTVHACTAPLGYVSDATDCDDGNALINPSATEICNGIDDNCNGQIDEGFTQFTFFHDNDGDGYGNENDTIHRCAAPVGYVSDATDCNDANASVNPSATEVCNGIDDNCNGQIDEGVQSIFFLDADDDGFGNVNDTVHACAAPVGYVSDATDCNDGNASINPSATEICNGIDDNCDGQIDEGVQTVFFHDADGDGFGNLNDTIHRCAATVGYVSDATDCNDRNVSINPSATEVCNGIDDNCDGQIDEGVQTVFFHDADGDGFGNENDTVHACTAPVGYISDATDCNDGNASFNPSATEVCNGIDDNCNGQIDEGVQSVFYHDADGDGFGNENDTVHRCAAPVGYVSDAADCNDANALINPSATEICNGIDDNCNGQIDEGFTQFTFFHDNDGDGYGNENDTIHRCAAPVGYVSDATDCDDGNVLINPSATEVCNGIDDNCDGQIDEGVQTVFFHDADGDGFGNENDTVHACTAPLGYVSDATDCDDGNVLINPSATEVCNGIDDNCDGQIDEGVQTVFFHDADGDGFGNLNDTIHRCAAPLGYISDATDCNDGNASVNPSATEVCNGIDDNCNGQIDEGVQSVFYHDADGDGFGNENDTVHRCSAPVGYVSDAADCNDANALINPSATEICNGIDDNCNGQIDEGVQTVFFHDADGDGFGNENDTVHRCAAPVGYVSDATDCNDANALINPSATEICNGIDDNCDGQIDEGVQTVFFHDADGDGFGNLNDTIHRCAAPVGYISDATDCNDGNASVNPSATEVCNGIDDNCNGQIDEGVQTVFFHDADGDGFGNLNDTIHRCAVPVGYVSDATDCNDGNASVNPSATEVCNGIDDNCNGQIDEGVQSVFYHDADGDGFGNVNDTVHACAAPVGYVSDVTDCDDGNASVNPSATEVCNGIDDNCNGQIDEGVQSVFYHDADGDGFGNENDTVHRCSAPVGYVSDATDCDDGNVLINPSATEVCNGIDDNCNGQIDEGVQTVFFHDADGDGFGNENDTVHRCAAPVGYVSDATDCNDGNASVNPSATEVCNGIDDNCNGQIDEGLQSVFYHDADGDGFGNENDTVHRCAAPVGYVSDATDCNDANALMNPSATEICNGIDDNCDGQIDEGVQTVFFHDADGDGFGNLNDTIHRCAAPVGYISDATDCNDGNASVNPSATEVCNGIDDNCNGQIDEGVQSVFYHDADGDGFGNVNDTVHACAAPVGYVSDVTDCDDGNASINPSAIEVCNGIDDNCNGQIDEGVQQTFYRDADNDGFGNLLITTLACSKPVGYVTNSADCNDGNGSINPSATEVCNGIDDNCNGQMDEGVQQTFYRDADNDGFGNLLITTLACSKPVGYVTNSTDCNDGNGSINPSATEVCNGIDDNCNGQIDEGVQQTFYRDADNDGFGNLLITTLACSKPVGYVTNSTDCNDGNASINPSAKDICNGIDDNCNGQIDENAITATISPSGTVSICDGTSTLLTANSGLGLSYQWIKNGTNITGAKGQTYSTNVAGNYKVKETNGFTCSSTSATTIISLKPLPTSTITPLTSLDICVATKVILQANSGTGLTYQWTKNGTPISGSTKIKCTTTVIGTFRVIVTGSNGCGKTSDSVKVIKSCARISNSVSNGNAAPDNVVSTSPSLLSLNPNPSAGIVTLNYSSTFAERVQISVFDIPGKILFTKSEQAISGKNAFRLNLNVLIPGIYYIELRNSLQQQRVMLKIER